jgi:hypothetical protein
MDRVLRTGRTSAAAAPLSKYAASAEVKMLARAMRQRWKALGRDARSLSKDSHVYWQRNCIGRGLKLLRQGELPILLEDYAGAEDLLAPFHVRYSAARAHGREPERAPAADAAWMAELEKALFNEEVAG